VAGCEGYGEEQPACRDEYITARCQPIELLRVRGLSVSSLTTDDEGVNNLCPVKDRRREEAYVIRQQTERRNCTLRYVTLVQYTT